MLIEAYCFGDWTRVTVIGASRPVVGIQIRFSSDPRSTGVLRLHSAGASLPRM